MSEFPIGCSDDRSDTIETQINGRNSISGADIGAVNRNVHIKSLLRSFMPLFFCSFSIWPGYRASDMLAIIRISPESP